MNQPLDSRPRNRRFKPFGIALLYAAFGTLWIVASGLLLRSNVVDPVLQERMELAKGLLFVVVTSSLLYLVLKHLHDSDLAQPVPISQESSSPGGVRWRLLAFPALLALVPLAGFVVTQVHGPQLEREAFANLKAIADLKAGQIENWLDERRNDGVTIMSSPGFVAQVAALQQEGGNALRHDIRSHLLAALDAMQYSDALLVDVQGKPLVEIGSFQQLPAQTSALLPTALASAKSQLSEIFADADGHLHLDIVIPLLMAEQGLRRPVGAVVLRLRPEHFLFPFIQHWPTASASGETLLVRRDGDSVLFINELRHHQGAGLTLRFPISRTDIPAVVAVSDMHSGSRQGKDYRGVPVFTAYRPVSGTDWIIVAKLDRDEVLAPRRELAFWVSLITLLAIATVGTVLLLLWRQRGRNLQLEMQAKSDRLLRQFYDLPFIGLVISSPAKKSWLQCNDRLCEILGYPRREMTQMSWHEMIHPEEVAANGAEFERIISGEDEGQTLETRFLRKDGDAVSVAVQVKCVRNASNAPEYLFITVQDITTRKLAEAKIQRLTNTYAARSECNQAIVRYSTPEELFPEICRFAVQFGGMKMAWVGLLDRDTLRIQPVASFGEGTALLKDVQVSADAESPFGRGATGTAIRELKPVWIQDYRNDPRTVPWHEWAAHNGFGAVAALPLTRKNAAFGALVLYAGEVNSLDENVRNLLAEMAMDISYALTSYAQEAERRQMEVALRESESRFRDLYEKAPLAYQSLDIAGNILEVNEAWLALLGHSRDEVIGHFIGDFLTDVSIRTLENEFPQFQQEGRVDGPLFHFVHKDGSQRVLMVNGQIARDQDGNFVRTHCILSDLTTRQQSEEQLRLAAQVFEQSAEGIIITDAEQNIVMVNRAFSTISGYSASEALGLSPRFLSSGHHDAIFYQDMWESIRTHGHWQGELWNRRKDGNIYPELVSISRVLDSDGHVRHYVGIFSDISEHKVNEAHIQRLAHFDALTGLPNRNLLADRVAQALSRMERNSESLALVFIDLDRFKNVNDSLGHRIGDELLVEVAERLQAGLRDEDTVSRLGGDEFILVLPGTSAEGAAHVAEKVLHTVSQPYRIGPHELTITPSLGIAMYPADGQTYETLSMCADAAMYRAKQNGRHTFRFFTREMQERSERTLQLENALRRALELDHLQLYFQPQLALESGRIIGVEALLRWQHPELGLVAPSDFIPVAEESGLILPIGEWVLRTAVRQMKAWMNNGMAPIVMAVNLSAVQFRQGRLPELVSQILNEYKLPPPCLELELTEGVAMDDPLAAIAVMNDLHARGIRMSIDDFGTGYSSLSYLKRFKVYKLKIDQSFVREISCDAEGEAIVEAIISLARSLGLQTIAEGVESTEQLNFLRENGCHEVQGYIVARPMPADQFEAFASSYRHPA